MSIPPDLPRRGRGRPRLDPPQRRSVALLLRFTPEEHAQVKERMRGTRRTLARFIREAALGVRVYAPRARVDADALPEIRRVGNNLNQLVRAAHEARLPGLEHQAAAVLNELHEVLRGVLLSEREQAAPRVSFPTADQAVSTEETPAEPREAGEDPSFWEPLK